MKKVLGVLAVVGLASGAMAQSFDGQTGFSATHLTPAPVVPEFTVNGAGSFQFQVSFGAFNAQGFTNYGAFNFLHNITHNGGGINFSLLPAPQGNRGPYNVNPAGNGVAGPTGITGIDSARNVINISTPWLEGDPQPTAPAPFTQGGPDARFNAYRFTINVTDPTVRDITITSSGIMQAISGWTFISGEPGAEATFTATAFVTDSSVTGTMILHIVPAPGAAALLGLGGLVATRRRR